MELKLFSHNKIAYEAAVKRMEKEGKAAVIHPTGTGKSLIAFQLALDHPDKQIIWLAPSEHIFRTQLENVQKILGEGSENGGEMTGLQRGSGISPFANIRFLTYSRLMKDVNSIEDLDYIVLDEFHRCGATEWGRGVKRLLEAWPDAKLLGLSATNIRYLDGQRDMAAELFDGKIASEMTLGEAIAKGILPAPAYVISMYFCQEELEKLKQKVQSVKNPGLRKENEKILEELKRTLEHAEGMDRIFAKHMPKTDGKYLVFCSGKQHMKDMMGKVPEWFCFIDNDPHVYAVTYDNPKNNREFASFQADTSGHLKLLFCIDMLNEGVHVDDIDGVILLRPTVSPILYLQQIGRSLSAGKTKQPVIFDVVNNFDNLYSIDSLKSEIENAFSGITGTTSDKQRLLENFRIMDEARDCRLLFEKLCKSLTASWDSYYHAAETYYQQHGDLRIAKSYVTPEGLTLGSWLQTQRRIYAKKIPGRLTKEQAARLDALGMEWQSGSIRSWNRGYQALLSYRKQYGNIDVKVSYVTEDGFALGKWISNLRQNRNVDEKQLAALEDLGMIWDKRGRQWEVSYQAAAAYYREHGNLRVPHDYHTEDGISLGVWIANQRSIYAGKKKGAAPLTENKIQLLNHIGMIWNKEVCHS